MNGSENEQVPDGIHYLSEQHLLIFLGGVVLLLGLVRGLGYLCSRIGRPALIGEILAGVLLGPTLLGRMDPALFAPPLLGVLVDGRIDEEVGW